jgi:hypothetical protein
MIMSFGSFEELFFDIHILYFFIAQKSIHRWQGDKVTRRPGDKETRGQGDQGTRRPGDKVTRRPGDKETRGQRGPGDQGTRGQGDRETGVGCVDNINIVGIIKTGQFKAIRYLFIFRHLPRLDSKHLTGFRTLGV